MSTKNKALIHNKRRQKAAMKAKLRVNRPRPKYHVSDASVAAMAAELFPDDQWVFWAAHGVNFLLSDYTEGVWTPMFEGIYDGAVVTPNDIAHALVTRYGADNEGWPPEGKAALAWVAQSREVGFIYKTECIKRLQAKGDKDAETTARLPRNGTVWEVFSELKTKLAQKKTI